jgi:hypothetical protein
MSRKASYLGKDAIRDTSVFVQVIARASSFEEIDWPLPKTLLCLLLPGTVPVPPETGLWRRALDHGVASIGMFGHSGEVWHDSFDEFAQPYYERGTPVVVSVFGTLVGPDALVDAVDCLFSAMQPLDEYLHELASTLFVWVGGSPADEARLLGALASRLASS